MRERLMNIKAFILEAEKNLEQVKMNIGFLEKNMEKNGQVAADLRNEEIIVVHTQIPTSTPIRSGRKEKEEKEEKGVAIDVTLKRSSHLPPLEHPPIDQL